MTNDNRLPRTCERMLSACSRKARSHAAVRGTALFVSLLLAVLIVEFFLDFQLDLPVAVRGVLLVVSAALLLRGLYVWLLRPFGRSPGRVALARLLEEHNPFLKGRLITAVQLSRPGNPAAAHVSPALIATVRNEAAEAAREVTLERLFPRRGLLLAFAALAFVCSSWAGVYAWKGDVFNVWVSRLAMGDQPWPRTVHLVLVKPEDGNIALARGDNLMIEVKVLRGEPREVDLVCEWENASVTEKVMTRWGSDIFRHTLTNLTQPLSLYAKGGDGRTARVSVQLMKRPHVEEITVRVASPAYTGLGVQESSDGNVKALIGSGVSFTAQVVPAAVKGELSLFASGEKEPFEGPKPLDVVPDGENDRSLVKGSFPVSRSGYYTLHFPGGNSFQSRDASRYRIRAVPDKVPQIMVTTPPPKEECTRDAVVPIMGKAADDWGIKSVVLSWRVRFDPEKEQEYGSEEEKELFSGEPEKDVPVESVLSLSDLTLKEGSTVLWRLKATDAAGGTGMSSKRIIVIVRSADLKKILFDELGMVREDIRSLAELQGRSRKRTGDLVSQTASSAALDPQAASVLGRVRSEELAVSRRLTTAAEKLFRIRDRMLNNMVGDLKDRRWIGALGEEIDGMADGLVAPLVDQLGSIVEKSASTGVSPDVLTEVMVAQGAIEKQLLDLVDRMTQFGDINLLIRRLQNILYHEEQINKLTRELMNE